MIKKINKNDSATFVHYGTTIHDDLINKINELIAEVNLHKELLKRTHELINAKSAYDINKAQKAILKTRKRK